MRGRGAKHGSMLERSFITGSAAALFRRGRGGGFLFDRAPESGATAAVSAVCRYGGQGEVVYRGGS